MRTEIEKLDLCEINHQPLSLRYLSKYSHYTHSNSTEITDLAQSTQLQDMMIFTIKQIKLYFQQRGLFHSSKGK